MYKLKKAKIHDVKILERKDTAIALGNPCTKNPWILGAFWGGLFSSYIPLLASLFGLHLVLDILLWFWKHYDTETNHYSVSRTGKPWWVESRKR